MWILLCSMICALGLFGIGWSLLTVFKREISRWISVCLFSLLVVVPMHFVFVVFAYDIWSLRL